VTYTKRANGRYDSGLGLGNGDIDVFDTHGDLLRRLVSGGPLDAPWGLALAPSQFGDFSNDLLVGNFADGHINAFDTQTGAFRGALTNPAGQSIAIRDLWALTFGNDGMAGASDTLFFAAGVGHERHGLVGSLQPTGVGSGLTGLSGNQQSILDGLQNSQPGTTTEGADDYPLPPTNGPILKNQPPPPESASVQLVPVQGSPLALVPSVSTTVEGSELSIVRATPPSPVGTGQGNGSGLATLASSSITQPTRSTLSPGGEGTGSTGVTVSGAGATSKTIGSGAGVAPAHFFSRTVESGGDLLASQGATEQETDRGRSGHVEDGIASVTAPGQEKTSLARPLPPLNWVASATIEETTHSDGPNESQAPLPNGTETASLAAVGPSLEGMLEPSPRLLLAFFAVCGISFSWLRGRLPGAAAFPKLNSLWSRSTRRPVKTIELDSEQARGSRLASTQVLR
jgi:hypothetical protein